MFFKCILLLCILSFNEADVTSFASRCLVPRISHGRARLRPRGNFVKYSCFSRYTLVGHKYATCRNGQWDEAKPVCIRSGCPVLDEVKNAVNVTSFNNSWIVFFCLPGHQLVGSPVVYCDGRQWNSTTPLCVDGSTKVATECDFEKSDICGWKLDEFHDFDWRRWNMKTPSSFLQTGPANDHTYGKNGTGFYMYIESTGRVENETARLISPVYSSDLAINGCFVFFYHMYGRSMGGLRVYQKPDNVPMYQMLMNKERYVLFELWGNQGNEWYSSVSMLSNFSDDFQIVIEGIRGVSFMSDIAIDDVSIQHGDNCTKAMIAATTPTPVMRESCVGRCEDLDDRGCSCSIVCVINGSCCPDYFDVCGFDNYSNETRIIDDDSSSSTEVLPQTQKLIATTSETSPKITPTAMSTTQSTTSTTQPTTSTTTTTTSTTTKRPTTKFTRPTTIQRTTITTTNRPRTLRTSTIISRPITRASTTPKPTKPRPTTARPTTPRPTTPRPTTPRSTTKFTKPIIGRKSTTVTPLTSTTTFLVKTTKHEDVTTTDAKTEIAQANKVVGKKKSEGMSGTAAAITIILVCGVCFGALWAAFFVTRTTRGVAALARIRGRASSDPEVRYLKTDEDD